MAIGRWLDGWNNGLTSDCGRGNKPLALIMISKGQTIGTVD